MQLARWLVILCLFSLAVSALAAVPTVVSTFPANGATEVPASTSEIRIRFSEAVNPAGCSFVNTDDGQPIQIGGPPTYQEGNTVCVLPVSLQPGVTYAVSINHARYQNFRSAATGEPVIPYLLRFTTSTRASSGPAPVRVIATDPPNGGKAVPLTLKVLRVRFSAPVQSGYSFTDSDQGQNIEGAGKPYFEEGNTVCVVPIKLRPGVTYAVGINNQRFQNFRSAATGEPVTPYLLRFTTAGERKASPAQDWRRDLAYLAEQLPARHVNLFHRLSRDEWERMVAELYARIPGMSEPGILAGMLRLVAAVGDQHTGINVLGSGRLARLHVALAWFADGIHVVAAPEQTRAVGCRVMRVGETGIEQACARISAFMPFDNESARRRLVPELLAFPDLLEAAGLSPPDQPVMLTLRDREGNARTLSLRADETGAGVRARAGGEQSMPLYLRHRQEPHWVEYVPEGNLVYLQYNQCSDPPDHPFAQARAQVERLLVEHPQAALVIDLRHNGGGNSAVLDPFIDWIKGNAAVNTKARLYVITGRNTFSSAVLNAARLRQETNACLVGEPPGGNPSHFGEVRSFALPNSGLTVRYSTKYFERGGGVLAPDLALEPTFADFERGADPVLEGIVRRCTQG